MSSDNGFAGPQPVLDLLAQLDQLVAAAEVVTPAAPTKSPGRLAVAGRAARHLEGLPDAIEGRQGRDRLPDAAQALAVGFALGVDEALPLLRAWDLDRCQPPWGDDALRDALEAAAEEGADDDRKGALREDGPAEPDGPAKTDVKRLIAIATGDVLLFHSPDPKPYAEVPAGEHREIHPLAGPAFRNWIIGGFYDQTGRTPKAETLRSAMSVLELLAGRGPAERVHVRMAEVPDPDDPDNPTYFLDLANEDWQAVRITRAGWEVVDRPPVRFRRPGGMLPLPAPEPGGSLDDLRGFVNLPDDDAWLMYLAVLTAHARPRGPYPILALGGEQGAAKSSTARVTRRMIDPHVCTLRTPPKDERDLMIAATNSGMLGFDNVSFLPDWLSDGLCRIATGGGLGTRVLYSDGEEIFFDVQRPIILNGIEDVATRGDLLDRCVILGLPEISAAQRREEAKFWRDFEAAHPRLLGALLDAVAATLATLPGTQLDGLPRMADFGRWGEAGSRARGGAPGAFLAAYEKNREEATEIALESSPVASAVRVLMAGHSPWTGTAADLLGDLGNLVEPGLRRSASWPKSPRGMAGALKRVMAGLP